MMLCIGVVNQLPELIFHHFWAFQPHLMLLLGSLVTSIFLANFGTSKFPFTTLEQKICPVSVLLALSFSAHQITPGRACQALHLTTRN